MKIALNLGAGSVPLAPPKHAGGTWAVVNHDKTIHSAHIDIAWDLDLLPWPWPNNCMSMIVAYAVFEHLNLTLAQSVDECWRILKPNGLLRLKLPLWDCEESWDDPTHRWHFGKHALDLFDPRTRHGKQYGAVYGVKSWRIIHQGTIPKGTSLYGQMEAVK